MHLTRTSRRLASAACRALQPVLQLRPPPCSEGAPGRAGHHAASRRLHGAARALPGLAIPPLPAPPSRPLSTPPVSGNGKLTFEMRRFLRQKGLDYSESAACLRLALPAPALGAAPTADWAAIDTALATVFLNKVTGNFVVPSVAAVGTWQDFQQLVETWLANRQKRKGEELAAYPTLQRVDLKLPSKEQKVWEAATPVETLSKEQFKDLLKNFRQVQRDFSVEDLARFEVRVEAGTLDKMYFPVRFPSREVVGLRVVKMVGSRLEEEDLPSTGRRAAGILPFIHNLQAAAEARPQELVLVGSVLDVVVLSARTELQVVALPDMTSLHPDLLPFLEDFPSLTLWLGSDVMTRDITALFATKLGEQRCRMVAAQHPSPLTAVRRRLALADILESALACHHDYITTFDKLRDDVYLEFVNSEQMEGVKWKRFEGLNGLLRGFRRGELTVLTGRTGSGKTTFLSEYSLDLCMEGVNTLWGSFEVKNVRLIKMLLKQFGLVNLDEEVEAFEAVAEKFKKLPMFFATFHGASETDAVLEAMSHAVYVHDIAHVIIDNVQFMIGTRGGGLDRMAQQDLAIERFRKFATLHNVHVTLVIHPRKETEEVLTVHSVYGGGKATQEADNVLLLQEEKNEDSFFKKKYVEIVKNRYAGDLGVVELAFTKPFLTMSRKVAEAARKDKKKPAKTTMPLVTKKKSGIVQESSETLVRPASPQPSRQA